MSTEQHPPNPELSFSETLKESDLNSVIQELLANIDYELLLKNPKLIRVNHPLLIERMGANVSVNNEIVNIMHVIVKTLTSTASDDDAELLLFEEILTTSAKDQQKMRLCLFKFNLIITRLESSDSNNAALVQADIHRRINEQLELPSLIQTLLLYPVVNADIIKQATSELITILSTKKQELIAALASEARDPDGLIADGISIEAELIGQWITKHEMDRPPKK